MRNFQLESTWIWRPLGCFDREILRWLVGELCHGFGQNCPCMHRVLRFFSLLVKYLCCLILPILSITLNRIANIFIMCVLINLDILLMKMIDSEVCALESILAFPSRSSCGIMRQHCDDRRNEVQSQEAHTVSCSIGGLLDVSTERSCGGSWVNPAVDTDKTAHACTVCVCIGADSGVPVQKLMRYHASTLR